MAKYLTKNRKATPRRKRLLIPTLTVFLALILINIVAVTGGVIAKYVRQVQYDTVAKAPDFYFTSNYLNNSGTSYTLAEGTGSFSFTLKNHDELNISQVEYAYEVTVTSQNTGYSIDYDKTTQQFTKNTKCEDIVTISGLLPGEYTITATPKDTYNYPLTAKLTVLGTSGVYKNTKLVYPDYVLLTVWTDDTAATVKVTVPTGLIPDGTDSALTGKTAGSEIELTLGVNQSRSLRFFITSDYDNSAVPVMRDNVPLGETSLN